MRLTDEQWAIVEPLIPIKRREDGKGRPRVDARPVLEAILWVLWTGAPWKALPAEYPVLLYSHVHLFAPAYWQECMTVKRGDPGWREALDRRGVNLVVVEADLHPSLCGELRRDPDWLVVLDQAGGRGNPANRLFAAQRKAPKQ